MRRFLTILAVLGLLGGVVFWILTEPDPLQAGDLPDHTADVENGRTLFRIGGCASCHARENTEGDERLVLEGGRRLPSPFGVFVAPNISTDPEQGVGDWSELEFANAMLRGLSPEGAHLYPAFPYVSYARMSLTDVLDLKAYMDTLPASTRANEPHELGFPFNIRRGLGLWKLLYHSNEPAPIVSATNASPQFERGRFLVEGPGHCGECHTPRSEIGGLDTTRWLTGAPSPDGKGRIPNISQGEGGIGSWSETDIAYYLSSGFTPEFDSSGGEMAEVIKNTSLLEDADREAIAVYLKTVGE